MLRIAELLKKNTFPFACTNKFTYIYQMANTYTRIYLHLIFAVKGRESLLPIYIQPRVHAYMTSILNNLGHHPIAVGGIDNHVHILLGYSPTQSIPDLARELKVSTTKFINTNGFIPFVFNWQRGYSCFSYSQSQVEAVKQYIRHQPEHHKGISLRDEVMKIYEKFGVEYDERYIFEE